MFEKNRIPSGNERRIQRYSVSPGTVERVVEELKRFGGSIDPCVLLEALTRSQSKEEQMRSALTTLLSMFTPDEVLRIVMSPMGLMSVAREKCWDHNIIGQALEDLGFGL